MKTIRLTAAAVCAAAGLIASNISPARAVPSLLHACSKYYLCGPAGVATYLTGSHTWNQSQSIGSGSKFTFNQFADYEQSIGSNFIRYWNWDQANEGDGTIPDSDLPFVRSTTSCCAGGIGGNKWNLNTFNTTFFNNMLANVQYAGTKAIRVGVMFFVSDFNSGDTYQTASWNNDPFKGGNNVNNVSPTTMGAEYVGSTINAAQEAYIAHVIDTLHGQSNVLWEICNEPSDASAALSWQNTLADYIKSYETSKGYVHHPIGITATYPDGTVPLNSTLYGDTHSDWTSVYGWYDYQSNPPDASTTKAAFVDSDHANSGYNPTNYANKDGTWIWEMFTRGYNVVLMDNMGGSGLTDPMSNTDTNDINMLADARRGIWTSIYAAGLFHLNASDFAAHDSRSSTGYALGSPINGEWAIFAPSGGTFTVDLTGYSGTMNKKWVNLDTKAVTASGTVTGGATRSFTAPNNRNGLILTPAVGLSATVSSSPSTITNGSSTTITYDSTGASSCTSDTFLVTAVNGSDDQSPTTTTTYTVDCTNDVGSHAIASNTVTVTQ